jgi:hypothetical protein
MRARRQRNRAQEVRFRELSAQLRPWTENPRSSISSQFGFTYEVICGTLFGSRGVVVHVAEVLSPSSNEQINDQAPRGLVASKCMKSDRRAALFWARSVTLLVGVLINPGAFIRLLKLSIYLKILPYPEPFNYMYDKILL